MSWIGPRPEAYVLSQWYEEELPFYRTATSSRRASPAGQVNQGHVADVADGAVEAPVRFYYINTSRPGSIC